MKKLVVVMIIAFLIGILLVPSSIAADVSSDVVDVLVQTDGSVDALATYIRAKGGTVRYQYENVPAIAASIPAQNVAAVARFSGVNYVEKDKLVSMAPADAAERPLTYTVEDVSGIELSELDIESVDLNALDGYANFVYTGALETWAETGYGAGTVVAVVDTGTVPNVCLAHSVIGAPGFPDGYNATGDGYAATSPLNHWHGTHVGGVIASSCTLDFSADPSDPLWLSIDAYLPWQIDNVPVLGQAPLANIYPVKVFDITGGSTPTSVILDGLDHLLTLKTSGALDIDVVNMSLGGGTVYDGGDTFDTFVNTMYLEDMVVVTSAGNAGPIPNSVGSPGTSWTALSVGALDYAPSSRVLYEFLGYRAFGTGGQGLVMRPTSETRVVNFSSRGPLSDGRGGPDLAALGHWNFQAGPVNELRWAGGTSFASPTVAGAAALLNSYWEAGHVDTNAFAIRQSLTAGADPSVVGSAWKNFNSQGYGALDVPAALQVLQNGVWPTNIAVTTGKLTANVLPAPAVGAVDVYESSLITLGAGKTKDFVLEVDEYTSDVIIEVYDMTAADNSAYAYWPNAIEFNIQSGKRSVAGPVEAWLWYPQFWGDSVTYIVSDGPWVESSGAFGSYEFANQPMEPGLMKVSLAGDYSNESPVSFKVRITREQLRTPQTGFYAIGRIRMGSSALIPVDVPAGVSEMTLDLVWGRDWSTFPTSDIEMFVYDPAFNLVSLDGATFNAPERAVITNPTAGTWYVFIDGYEMYRTDRYKLFVTMD